MSITFDQKDLESQIVNQAAEQIAADFHTNQNEELRLRLEELVETTVTEHCDRVVAPIIENGVADFVISRTNEFGEEKGEDVTFTEYITSLADGYLNESVDYKGEVVKRDSYQRNKAQSRLTHLLNEHLHFRIESVMKDAIKIVVEQIAPAIATTCEIKVKVAIGDVRRAMGK